MKFKLFGCKIFEREIASVCYACPNIVDVTTIRQRLHDKPKSLNALLQEEIDAFDANEHRYSNDARVGDYDAILLAYGLCSSVAVGLGSSRYPLVIPRTHDCIALLMGDRELYNTYYKEHPSTFYYSCGYAENYDFVSPERERLRLEFYLQRYGGDERRARRVLEAELSMTAHYDNVAYISWDGLDFPEYEQQARDYAAFKSWDYERIDGSSTLLDRLVRGEWDEENFLVVPPGHCIEQSFDERILIAAPR